MRGIERLVAGALLVMAVTGTAVLARTSAPGGGRPQALRLQSPPRSRAVAPLPVVVAVPEPPRRSVAAHPVPEPVHPVSVALAKPIQVPPAAPPPSAPATPVPAPTPPAAPAPAPTPAPSPAPTTRVVAAAQPQPETTTAKTFGHSHPRGHAWGHVKHALTTLAVADASQPPPPAPAVPAAPPAPDAPPASEADNGNGNGNGHAYGHSKHGDGD
jgi:outer membrane biosynthesis protein TonB